MNEFLRRLELYDETEEVSRRLRHLAITHSLRGKRLHGRQHSRHDVSTRHLHINHTERGRISPFEDIAIVTIPDVTVAREGEA